MLTLIDMAFYTVLYKEIYDIQMLQMYANYVVGMTK